VNAFGAELTRGWHISFYIYQQYNMHYTVKYNWRKQFYSDEIWNSIIIYFVHPDKNLIAFHTPYIPTDPVQFEFENSRGP